MTDAELIAAIAKIIRAKPRLSKADAKSVEARDLARYDQIAGLIARHLAGGA
jgi:hypothetical protein